MTAQSPGCQAIPWQVILQVTVSVKWGSVCLFGMQAVSTADILMACASPFSFTRSPLGWRLSRPGQQTQLLKPVGWLVADMAILTAADFQIFTSILPQPAPSRGKTLSWCCRRPGKNLIHDFYPMFSRMSESFPLIPVPVFSPYIMFVPERCHFAFHPDPGCLSCAQTSTKPCHIVWSHCRSSSYFCFTRSTVTESMCPGDF